MTRRPPAIFCRECGKDLGRGWAKAPLCDDCAPNHVSDCTCDREALVWNDECPVHHSHNPWDIPF